MSHKTADPTPRKQPKARAERARKALAGATLRREDSDDELGYEDLPWEWVYSGGDVSEEEDDNDVEDSSFARKRGRPPRKIQKPPGRNIVGAKNGSFECKIGDCVLLKADSNEAWAGIICDFLEEDDEKGVTIMWFNSEKEISNKQKKRSDYLPNELYISTASDFNPIESINGKAVIMSKKMFDKKYPTGKIQKKAKGYGKTFICRRGCNTRNATYTEEFIWEDIYHGTAEDVERLTERLKAETTLTRKSGGRKRIKVEAEFEESDNELEQETPRKKRKTSTVSTPRKPRTPSKLLTPSHKSLVKVPAAALREANLFIGLSSRSHLNLRL
jgi:origin recognition complex subunit 1